MIRKTFPNTKLISQVFELVWQCLYCCRLACVAVFVLLSNGLCGSVCTAVELLVWQAGPSAPNADKQAGLMVYVGPQQIVNTCVRRSVEGEKRKGLLLPPGEEVTDNKV